MTAVVKWFYLGLEEMVFHVFSKMHTQPKGQNYNLHPEEQRWRNSF